MNKRLIILLLFLTVFIKTGQAQQDAIKENSTASCEDSIVVLEDFNISLYELISLSKWGRNPFLPFFCLSTDNISASETIKNNYQPVLKKIFWKNNTRCAYINNKIVRQGDSYLDMQVRYIGESLVIMMKNNVSCMFLRPESPNADKLQLKIMD